VPREVFWPMISNKEGGDFRFDVAATDLTGNRVTFAMPLLFVGENANRDKSLAVRDAYDLPKTTPRRTARAARKYRVTLSRASVDRRSSLEVPERSPGFRWAASCFRCRLRLLVKR
jgi:hypothetical protein